MGPISQIDIAPTIASMLDIRLQNADGVPIEAVSGWSCKNSILIIVDSLGYDLYLKVAPRLKFMPALAANGHLFRAQSVSNHTSPAIASILSGLLPEHHMITDTKSAKSSPLLSIPEIASSSGKSSAVVMEKGGAEVYDGLIEFVGAVPRTLRPSEFDQEVCRLSVEALSARPRLLVSYFIGLDKAAHNGLSKGEFVDTAVAIDRCVGKILYSALPDTLVAIVGDHPVHAGPFKRTKGPYCVALILGKLV
jgi:predicted AlkP superfamily pyrophosphatase or phosphodiesterase